MMLRVRVCRRSLLLNFASWNIEDYHMCVCARGIGLRSVCSVSLGSLSSQWLSVNTLCWTLNKHWLHRPPQHWNMKIHWSIKMTINVSAFPPSRQWLANLFHRHCTILCLIRTHRWMILLVPILFSNRPLHFVGVRFPYGSIWTRTSDDGSRNGDGDCAYMMKSFYAIPCTY